MIDYTKVREPNVIHIKTAQGMALILPAISLTDDAHPTLDLCLHKGVDWDTPWAVSERTTGLRIAAGDSQSEAIILATARLAMKSDEEIAQAIANHKARSGQA